MYGMMETFPEAIFLISCNTRDRSYIKEKASQTWQSEEALSTASVIDCSERRRFSKQNYYLLNFEHKFIILPSKTSIKLAKTFD